MVIRRLFLARLVIPDVLPAVRQTLVSLVQNKVNLLRAVLVLFQNCESSFNLLYILDNALEYALPKPRERIRHLKRILNAFVDTLRENLVALGFP